MGDIAVDQDIASEFVKFLTAQLKGSRDEVERLNQVRFNLPGFFGLSLYVALVGMNHDL